VSDNAETGPGLPPASFDLGSVRITKVSVGPSDNNAYVVTDVATDSVLLVDAAAEAPVLNDLLMGHDVVGVLTTHRHRDHWSALEDVVRTTGAPTFAHAADAPELPFPPDVLLADGDAVAVGVTTLSVRHVPGHTPGSLIVIVRGSAGPTHLLTGDSLFPGGVGNTWGDKDNFELLLGGVTREVFEAFPDDTVIDPGHGKSTTVGAERPHLAEWAERGW